MHVQAADFFSLAGLCVTERPQPFECGLDRFKRDTMLHYVKVERKAANGTAGIS